jgi:hypothetical protein
MVLMGLSFSACGGGGGGGGGTPTTSTGSTQTTAQTVSGVAATGVPICGTVTLKDADGVQLGPVSTGLDGSFSFDVTGLTPPFILEAQWTSNSTQYALFSIATGTGQANVNPFSNLTLQLASGSDPSTLFNTIGTGGTSAPGNGGVSAALAEIKAVLAPVLAEYGITDFDPINMTYVAGPENSLDTLLDLITIQANNGTFVITNAMSNAVIATGSLSDPADAQVNMSNAPDATVLTDVQDITAQLAVLCNDMNLGATLTASVLDGLFIADPYYGTSAGYTRTQDIQSIVSIFGPNGTNTNGQLAAIRNVRLVADLTSQYSGRDVTKVYEVNYDFIFESGTIVPGNNNVTFGKEQGTGLWKFIGDPTGGDGGNNYGAILTTGNLGVSGTLTQAFGNSVGTFILTTGGNFGTDITDVPQGGICGFLQNVGTFVMNGGTFSPSMDCLDGFTGTLEVNGGTFNVSGDWLSNFKGTLTIGGIPVVNGVLSVKSASIVNGVIAGTTIPVVNGVITLGGSTITVVVTDSGS